MRKVILGLAVSLDSFIEGPNGEYDWCFTDQDYGLNEFYKNVDSVFIGRKSYEMSYGLEDGGGFGLPKMKEYVFSNTLKRVKDGTTIISGDIKAEVEKIKQEEGKDIWLFGGGSLTASLMNLGLVDELWLSVHPILLGEGKPLFQGLKDRTHLKLIDTKVYETGLVSLKYVLV
ncbi:dihydrofolate reductase family protein [Emticicia sp. C21]|uniref:dihydrofolate reductase family protein n=1 Tax=Emticicia sp. C21 TaxID=2302915 RepID=UPI000E34D046|nr:dihydrofolate reductase family protein [Emticicia sp. C21]RFS17138.1 dihydrofolate reductase [Emticicia sp. C21]